MNGPGAAHPKGVLEMSHFEVSDETMAALWAGLASDLEKLAPLDSAHESFMELMRCHFLHVICHFPHSAIVGVTSLTPGADNPFRIAISDKARGHLTATAKDFVLRFRHLH